MSNRIEQLIGAMEEYINGCKMQPFSSTKIVVERPQLDTFLEELRQYTPEEIRKYQRMLNNRDKIMATAHEKARDVENRAKVYAEHVVSESSIVKMANEKANEIILNAQEQARDLIEQARARAAQIQDGAVAYTNELLGNLSAIINGTIDDAQARFSALLTDLSEHARIVEENRSELNDMQHSLPEEDEDFRGPFVEVPEEDEEEND